ncbi:signal peptidase II [Roseburia sp. 499]|uniref:signal peptidase II n=1 Tax=Roseburia sp. 499 TaxID=1261634 RepID=UPI00095134F3|nr:signal peptidase II [Roseburia sp. 499]WVK71404.1 signal peptidase II [Roseburia sp. 499]
MTKNKKMSCLLGIIVTILLIFLDQFTKYLAAIHLKDGNSISIMKDVFCLQYLENQGAAFGMFQGGKIVFVVITILLVAVMSYVYWHCPMDKRYVWIRVIIMFLMAGAFGNLIDRIRLDYVIDFFYFELINFPIFNVADIYVSCSVAALLILFIFYYKEEDVEVLLPSRKKKHAGNEAE